MDDKQRILCHSRMHGCDRSDLPFKLRRRIGIRLGFYFMLSGLLTGLFVYCFTVVFDTRVLVAELGKTILTHNKSAPAGPHAQIMRDRMRLLRRSLTSESHGILISLYVKKTNAVWQEARIGSNDIILVTAAAAMRPELEKAMEIRYTQLPVTNTNVVYAALFSVVDEDTNEKYVLRLTILRNVFIEKIRADKELLIGYGVILSVFSLLLGVFFSGKITSPINELSDAAICIARGDFSYRNRIRGNDEIGFLGKTLNYMAEKVDSHIQEIDYRARTMDAMNRIDKTVLVALYDPNVVGIVAGIVADFLKSGLVLLAVPDEQKKVFVLSEHRKEGAQTPVNAAPIPFAAASAAELRTRVFEEYLVTRDAPVPAYLLPVVNIGSGTILHAPLTSAGVYQGSCIIIDEDDKDGFDPGEREAIRMLADQVGVALQNSRVYREKETLFLDLLLALTRAIDAKSKWTGGHSERVASLAVSLGKEAGMSDGELNALNISSLLHDIGKIATPESILDKPGKLTDEEYAVIKHHPEEGARIIGHITSYENIVPGILHHHEHFNGKGYPHALSGNDIPLASRIICIADVYDAIIADRPYRAGMGEEKALAFMKENAGVLFDPKLLAIFLDKVIKELIRPMGTA